jgi:glycosyltransferase involved in cell wall biosynthesis
MGKKLRIAFIDFVLEPDKPGRSGMSDTIWDMSNEFLQQGHEVHIIGTYTTNQFPNTAVSIHNFPTPPIGYRNVIGHLWILKRATDVIKRIRPDVVHVRDYLSSAVSLSLGVKAPIVLTVPGNIFLRIQQGHGYEWHYVQVLKWAARISARRCNRIIATSQEMKYWWEWTGSKPEETLWIPLGVNTSRFNPMTEARKQLNIPKDKIHLLYVGRFSKEKGLLDLIDALVNIKHVLQAANIRITLIGKGSEDSAILERLDREGLNNIVNIVPWVEQDMLSAWYSSSDALILPSWNEPFGKVMIEAMACGTPVISSATEGPKDHIRHAENGFLFQLRNVKQLASILEEVILNPDILRDLRVNCITYIQENLTWRKIAERIVQEVYLPIFSDRSNNIS